MFDKLQRLLTTSTLSDADVSTGTQVLMAARREGPLDCGIDLSKHISEGVGCIASMMD